MHRPNRVIVGVMRVGLAGVLAWTLCSLQTAAGEAAKQPAATNLALVAVSSTSYVSPHETIKALNDGFDPDNSDDKRNGAYGNWPRNGVQWVEYQWTQPITADGVSVYWFDDNRGVRLPKACRLQYWDGNAFAAVPGSEGLGLKANCYNPVRFKAVTTTKLRMELESNGTFSTGLLEWKVFDSGASPNFPPSVEAGVDRAVVRSGATYLSGFVRDDGKPNSHPGSRWSKESGPGDVVFSDAESLQATATFSAEGTYILKLVADDGDSQASDQLTVTVVAPPPAKHLAPVWTTPYSVSSPLWRSRLKQVIVNWIPHCIRKIEDPAIREGGLDNFVEAGNKLAGRPFKPHVGAPFANAWVYNTLESMCIALLLDPQGDKEITASQADIRRSIDDWIPKILSAQEPDGYLHTQYTIHGHPRWTNRGDHEGYQAGYFIEAAIAHHTLTDGKDRRMLDAACRLADCWCRNIGPAPKRTWYDGHQELELALVRLARYLDSRRESGNADQYRDLAKFLLDSRSGGEEYDQSHVSVTRQYEAVGHAVRAVYSYTGMADVAMETGNVDYQSAVASLWQSIVDRKYYVTGGVGSGETSEGFGKEYSLPVNAYCESCAGCGELFFQHRMQLAYHDSRYADLYEDTLYNAILGSLDFEAKHFTYTNSLDSGERRYEWHVCPCCVGNIPRTLLSLPTWTYSTDDSNIYVNLYIDSSVRVGQIAGTDVKVRQTTEYPWKGAVSIVLEPAKEQRFTVRLRVPNRSVSALYECDPAATGLVSLAVNGQAVEPTLENGYAVIDRNWKPGDRIDLTLPLSVQRITPSPRIAATAGRVALRYGPLIYNVEAVDQSLDGTLGRNTELKAEWDETLLGGLMTIRGTWKDGSPLKAIPNYARLNRGGRSLVWLKAE